MRARPSIALGVSLVVALSPLSPWTAIASAVRDAALADERQDRFADQEDPAGPTRNLGDEALAPENTGHPRPLPNLSRIGHGHRRVQVACRPATVTVVLVPPAPARHVPSPAPSSSVVHRHGSDPPPPVRGPPTPLA